MKAIDFETRMEKAMSVLTEAMAEMDRTIQLRIEFSMRIDQISAEYKKLTETSQAYIDRQVIPV